MGDSVSTLAKPFTNPSLGGGLKMMQGVTKDILGIQPAPDAPDYVGAANATAAGNLQAAKYATVANRANQYNPYGSLTWQKGATDFDPWTQTVNFTPQGQKLFDTNAAIDQSYADAAKSGMQNIQGLLANPNIDESKLTAMPTNAGMTSQQAMMSRLRPTLDQEQNSLDAKLANQGITLGSDAYRRAMNLQGQRMNDLELQAAAQGINMDMNARQQGLQEQYARMQQPLNIVNALKSGSQVSSPQFNSYAQQATTQGPNLTGAMQNTYQADLNKVNANNAFANNMMQGLFSMGGAAMMSDRRLKKNIKLVGKTDGGNNIYSYNYVWGGPTQMGVMAQEVEKTNPDAVTEIGGYKAVDYSKVK